MRLVYFSWLAIAAALPGAACDIEVSLGRQALESQGGTGDMFNPGTGGSSCEFRPDVDSDGDGYRAGDGDCDDCDAHVNPDAVEVVHPDPRASRKDEDCDGDIDEEDDICDGNLALDDADPLNAARAIELCKMSSGPTDWGVVEARWTMPDGSEPPAAFLAPYHLGHGLLPNLGANVPTRRGKHLLALSSGTARRPTDPGFVSHLIYDKGYTSNHPPGFPKESPSCPGVTTGMPHDAIALEVKLRAPSNAYGISFDFDFYTYEWPEFICQEYNDIFIALMSPPPPSRPDGNISFDSQGNPVSVNNAFLDVCGCVDNPPVPCTAGLKVFSCALGNSELVGTGFGMHSEGIDHAATSWLVTRAPVVPSSTFSVRFAIYDSRDGLYNSMTLIDNWRWIAKPGTDVNTQPVPK